MDGYVTIGTKLDTSGFDKGLEDLSKNDREAMLLAEELEKALEKYKELTEGDIHFESEVKEAEQLKQQINAMANEIGKLTGDKFYIKGFNDVKQQVDNIGGSVDKAVKKVGKWALGVFSVRTAFNLVRQAISTLSNYNDQIKTDIEYIRFALASTLQPIIEWLIQAVYKILSLIGGVIKSVFGINIFANATTKAFNKSNKEIAKMRKQLAGFDEANVLQDNTKQADKIKTPSTDLSKIQPIDVNKIIESLPGIIETIFGKIHEIVTNGFNDIIGTVTRTLSKLGFSDLFIQGIEYMIESAKHMLLGFIDIIKGILQIVVGLLTGNADLVKEGFKSVIEGLLHIFISFVYTILSRITIALSWIIESFKKLFSWWKSGFQTIVGVVKSAWAVIKGVFSTIGSFISGVFNTIWNIIKGVFNKIGTVFGDLKTKFKDVFDSLWDIAKGPLNLIIDGINKLIKGANKFKIDIPDWVPEIGGKKFGINIPTIPKLAKGGIINMPGRGVAIGGESGREAVLPLQDSQVLSEIADAIGRRITINANITNTMNGRVISRELQKINNENNFAYNR